MDIKTKAETKANNYIKYALGDTPAHDEAFSAKEDYMAGYIAGAEYNKTLIDFVRSQLQFIKNSCKDKGEVQSQALLQYVIDRIK